MTALKLELLVVSPGMLEIILGSVWDSDLFFSNSIVYVIPAVSEEDIKALTY